MEIAAVRPASEYRLARKVLLDALQALGAQREAVVLVGAQDIYLQVGEADLAVPVMTTDGDLALDPRLLGDVPLVGAALLQGGFVQTAQPGSWRGEGGVLIDLMVPAALARPPGHRGADLGVHGRSAARQAAGLEAAVVDHRILTVASFDPEDARAFEIAVAGPAALLVAKLTKIAERVGSKRLEDKDALDVLRLLRGTESRALGRRLVVLSEDPVAGAVSQKAVGQLSALFGRRDAAGCAMAARAAWPVEPAEVIVGSCVALAQEVLAGVGG